MLSVTLCPAVGYVFFLECFLRSDHGYNNTSAGPFGQILFIHSKTSISTITILKEVFSYEYVIFENYLIIIFYD